MKNWNKLSKKLPKINKAVFILNSDKSWLNKGKLRIYQDKNQIINPEDFLKDGDIYWSAYNLRDEKLCWAKVEEWPYWIYHSKLIKLVLDKEEKVNVNRFEILDIEEENEEE